MSMLKNLNKQNSKTIASKSIGMLIDELITTNLRCWAAQDSIMDTNLTETKRLEAAVRAQQQNARRSELIKVIDNYFGDTRNSTPQKTYYTYFKNDENK